MKSFLGNTEELLELGISGFHQYILNDFPYLCHVSKSLCNMLGYTKEDLIKDSKERIDSYALLVHPADRGIYADFLRRLKEKEQTVTVQYRIRRKDGSVRYVSDTAVSRRLEDGTLVASSVLTDVTAFRKEAADLRFISETVPCGFLRFSADKHPKITYLNDRMQKLLRFSETRDGELEYMEMYKENIFLLLPMEERRNFAHLLTRVPLNGSPISGEMTFLRFDGSKVRVYGWLTRQTDKDGNSEYRLVCADITENYRAAKESETERYLNALTEVYDKIFAYDFSSGTVTYLYSRGGSTGGWMQHVPMKLEEATTRWIQNGIYEEDREKFRSFFVEACRREARMSDRKPPQIVYRAVSSSGEFKRYAGIFLKVDDSVFYFCCRQLEENADTLRQENDTLRSMNENMQELVMRFTEGIIAFEVQDGYVKPLYTSDNVCEFFGYTQEEWVSMANERRTVKEFISHSSADYDEVQALFERGEAEFEYRDVRLQTTRRIKAVCTNVGSGEGNRRYVMLYNLDVKKSKRNGAMADSGHIYIRTFGYFDVFVDEKPIAFRNKKSKELFALLVDRRGGYVSSEEAISFLWENEPVSAVTLARYRKVALRLKNILEEYGIADVVESVDGKRRIVAEKVRCDLYDYLSGSEEYAQLFKGSYLSNYSWGETTLGELTSEHRF